MIRPPRASAARMERACAALLVVFLALAIAASNAPGADSANPPREAAMKVDVQSFQELVRRVAVPPPRTPIDPAAARIRAYRVSPEAIAARKKAVADVVQQIDPGKAKSGKFSLRVALARLQRNPADPASLECVRRVAELGVTGDPFDQLYLAQVFGRFGSSFPQPLHEAMRLQAERDCKYLAGGTENMLGMRRVAAMVFGEAFPDLKTPYGLSGRELAAEAVKWIRRYGREVYHWSMSEYLSTIYLGVHNEIWLTAKECARTEEARFMSRAVLDWIWSDLAVNSHLGQVLPPLPRDKLMLHRGPQMTYPNTHIQWLSWLYWGDERSRLGQEELPPYMAKIAPKTPINDVFNDIALGLQSAISPAMSGEHPNEIIRSIGAKRVAMPYRLLQSRANFGVVIATGENPAVKMPSFDKVYRDNLRSIYVAKDYGIGAGCFRQNLDSENLMHLMHNGIVYKSGDPLNRFHVSHPYWYTALKDETTGTELGLDNWSGKSPFEQCLQWDNTVLYLFDIPEADPYLGAAIGTKNPKWLSERRPKCIQAACVYVPASIDEKRQTTWGWLLREGDVYVAVRPFGAERVEWQKCDHAILAGYDRLVLHGSLMGAVIEVGDRDEYGSADAFIEKVGNAAFDLSKLASEKEARYVTTRGVALRLQFAPGGGFPRAWVDGAAGDFENWPVCESPYVSSRNDVLDVNDGSKGFSVDWSGENPVYTYYDLVNGAKKVTGGEWLENGAVKTK